MIEERVIASWKFKKGVLDAKTASLCYLAERLPIHGTGITLSSAQAQMARQFIEAAGLSQRVECLEGDFTNLPSTIRPADVAYAIESFVHGPSAQRFFEQSHRVLKPGAVMRAAIPDASKYIRSYCDPEHDFLNGWRDIAHRGLPPLLGLQEEFYGFGHCTIYDYETFAFFCETVGFASVQERRFGESAVQPCPDSEWRITDSFYADVVK